MSAIKYDSCSAAITDLIEDPHDNGDYRLHIEGDDLNALYDAAKTSDKQLAKAIACLKLIAEQGGSKVTEEGVCCNGSWCAEQARQALAEIKP